jgi:hypothetical protein
MMTSNGTNPAHPGECRRPNRMAQRLIGLTTKATKNSALFFVHFVPLVVKPFLVATQHLDPGIRRDEPVFLWNPCCDALRYASPRPMA